MNSAHRQRVIVHTEPHLLGAAVGAWLSRCPDLDVVVDPGGSRLMTAGTHDVVVVSAPFLTDATVVLIDSTGLSVIGAGTFEVHPYQGLDQLYSVIKQMRRPPIRGSTLERSPKGGGST